MSYLVNITRATGWPRDYILWELPLAHGLQIQHAEAIFQGEIMDWADGSADGAQISAQDAMRMQFNSFRKRDQDAD